MKREDELIDRVNEMIFLLNNITEEIRSMNEKIEKIRKEMQDGFNGNFLLDDQR